MIDNFIIDYKKNINDALNLIDKNARGIVFVVKNKKLVGVLTDGDIRRFFLKGLSLNSAIEKVMNKEFVSLNTNSSEVEIKKILKEGVEGNNNIKIKCVPIVNDLNEIINLRFDDETIPIFEPNLSGNELKYLINCLKSNWISSKGPYINKFEKIFEDLHSGYKALATSSGTTALHLSLVAQGIGSGDEVIVPNLTFAASINTIIHSGATPVIVDVNPETLTIDPIKIEEVISKKTKAIMPVHLFGHSCDMDAIVNIANKKNLLIVEDCAEAIGTKYKKKRVGTFGNASAFSFFGNKTITTGEGGMVLFKSEKDYQKGKKMRDHGMSYTKRYWHDLVGYNYRMTNMQAAVGVAQMERLDEIVDSKRKIAEKYNMALSSSNFLKLPTEKDWCYHSYWTYAVILKDKKLNFETLEKKFKLNNVEIRPFFYPLSSQPPYKTFRRCKSLSNSIELAKKGFCLPSSVNLDNKMINKVCEVLNSIVNLNKMVGNI